MLLVQLSHAFHLVAERLHMAALRRLTRQEVEERRNLYLEMLSL